MSDGFFDKLEKLSAQKRGRNPDAPVPGDSTNAPTPLSVSQITAMIERAIKANVPSSVYIKAEISNYSFNRASGHHYFSLKDDKAVLRCAMFARDATTLRFTPKDGMEVLATGRIGVYAVRGEYQMYVARLEPVGQGSLELALRQLREKLEKEGLFDPDRKKPLPEYPRTIALVTSKETAALQDMLKVLRAFPWLRLLLMDVPVQGAAAAPKIAEAIKLLSRHGARLGVEVILLARGGGSLEDLWSFNDESVSRAMAGCPIPIITGIGHETDVSVADQVADYHAHTPTEAARIITMQWKVAQDALMQSGDRLRRELVNRVRSARQHLESIERHEFFRRPLDRINQLRQQIDDRQRSMLLALQGRLAHDKARLAQLGARLIEHSPKSLFKFKNQQLVSLSQSLERASRAVLQRKTEQLTATARHLEALGPMSVLNRGYSITSIKKDGKTVRSANDLKGGERIVTRFKDGQRESVVDDPNQPRLF